MCVIDRWPYLTNKNKVFVITWMIHSRCILEWYPAFSCLLSLYFYFTLSDALSCTNRLIISDLRVCHCRYNLLRSFTTIKRHYTSILQSSFHFGSDVHITQKWPTYFLVVYRNGFLGMPYSVPSPSVGRLLCWFGCYTSLLDFAANALWFPKTNDLASYLNALSMVPPHCKLVS